MTDEKVVFSHNIVNVWDCNIYCRVSLRFIAE